VPPGPLRVEILYKDQDKVDAFFNFLEHYAEYF